MKKFECPTYYSNQQNIILSSGQFSLLINFQTQIVLKLDHLSLAWSPLSYPIPKLFAPQTIVNHCISANNVIYLSIGNVIFLLQNFSCLTFQLQSPITQLFPVENQLIARLDNKQYQLIDFENKVITQIQVDNQLFKCVLKAVPAKTSINNLSYLLNNKNQIVQTKLTNQQLESRIICEIPDIISFGVYQYLLFLKTKSINLVYDVRNGVQYQLNYDLPLHFNIINEFLISPTSYIFAQLVLTKIEYKPNQLTVGKLRNYAQNLNELTYQLSDIRFGQPLISSHPLMSKFAVYYTDHGYTRHIFRVADGKLAIKSTDYKIFIPFGSCSAAFEERKTYIFVPDGRIALLQETVIQDKQSQIQAENILFDFVEVEGAEKPSIRFFANLTQIDPTHLLLSGGVDADFNFVPEIFIFDIVERKWFKQSKQLRLIGHQVLVFQSKIIVLFGYDCRYKISEEIYEVKLDTNSTLIQSIIELHDYDLSATSSRAFFNALVQQNYLVLIGGTLGFGEDESNTIAVCGGQKFVKLQQPLYYQGSNQSFVISQNYIINSRVRFSINKVLQIVSQQLNFRQPQLTKKQLQLRKLQQKTEDDDTVSIFSDSALPVQLSDSFLQVTGSQGSGIQKSSFDQKRALKSPKAGTSKTSFAIEQQVLKKQLQSDKFSLVTLDLQRFHRYQTKRNELRAIGIENPSSESFDGNGAYLYYDNKQTYDILSLKTDEAKFKFLNKIATQLSVLIGLGIGCPTSLADNIVNVNSIPTLRISTMTAREVLEIFLQFKKLVFPDDQIVVKTCLSIDGTYQVKNLVRVFADIDQLLEALKQQRQEQNFQIFESQIFIKYEDQMFNLQDYLQRSNVLKLNFQTRHLMKLLKLLLITKVHFSPFKLMPIDFYNLITDQNNFEQCQFTRSLYQVMSQQIHSSQELFEIAQYYGLQTTEYCYLPQIICVNNFCATFYDSRFTFTENSIKQQFMNIPTFAKCALYIHSQRDITRVSVGQEFRLDEGAIQVKIVDNEVFMHEMAYLYSQLLVQ